MYECLVVADDLTGANGTGVLLANKKLKMISIFEKEKLKNDLPYEGIVYSTNTRCSDKEDAYKAVSDTLKSFNCNEVLNFGKRIDSTLRGNLGAEIDAFMDVLGDDMVGCVVPCYPKMGRIVKNGIMHVNGVLLEETEAATDALKPVRSSKVEDIIKEQTDRSIKSFHHFDLQQGHDALINKVKKAVQNKQHILVFDGVCEEDISLIADVIEKSGIKFFSVDPGPFIAEVINKKKNSNKVLAVDGTTNPVARKQLETLISSQDIYSIEVVVKDVLYSDETKKKEQKRVVGLIKQSLPFFKKYCVYEDSIFPEKKNDLDAIFREKNVSVDQLMLLINSFFAEIAFQVFKQDDMFNGLFSCGGDITVAVCKRFEAHGMIPKQEIIPLAVFGNLQAGNGRNVNLITKGGMVGDNDAMERCVDFLNQIKIDKEIK